MLRGQWSPDSLNVCHCRVSTGSRRRGYGHQGVGTMNMSSHSTTRQRHVHREGRKLANKGGS